MGSDTLIMNDYLNKDQEDSKRESRTNPEAMSFGIRNNPNRNTANFDKRQTEDTRTDPSLTNSNASDDDSNQ